MRFQYRKAIALACALLLIAAPVTANAAGLADSGFTIAAYAADEQTVTWDAAFLKNIQCIKGENNEVSNVNNSYGDIAVTLEDSEGTVSAGNGWNGQNVTLMEGEGLIHFRTLKPNLFIQKIEIQCEIGASGDKIVPGWDAPNGYLYVYEVGESQDITLPSTNRNDLILNNITKITFTVRAAMTLTVPEDGGVSYRYTRIDNPVDVNDLKKNEPILYTSKRPFIVRSDETIFVSAYYETERRYESQALTQGDVTVTYVENGVIPVGTTAEFYSAIDAIRNSAGFVPKITLMDDIELNNISADIYSSSVYLLDNDAIIDLNGHALKAESGRIFFNIENYRTLTLMDSSADKTGSMTGIDGLGGGVGNHLIFDGGTYSFSNPDPLYNYNKDFVTIHSGTFRIPSMKQFDSGSEEKLDGTYLDGFLAEKSTLEYTALSDGNAFYTYQVKDAPAPVLTAPQAADLAYTGEEQTLLIPGTVEGGTLQYGMGKTIITANDEEITVNVGDLKAGQVLYPIADGAISFEGGTVNYTYIQENKEKTGNLTKIQYTKAVQETFKSAVIACYFDGSLRADYYISPIYHNNANALIVTAKDGNTVTVENFYNKEDEPVAVWEDTPPAATQTGEYPVFYRVVGDETHGDILPVQIMAEIKLADISKADVTFAEDDPAEVKSVVLGGKTLTNGEDYKISYSQKNVTETADGQETEYLPLDEKPTASGDYRVTVTGIGNYRNTKDFEFNIRHEHHYDLDQWEYDEEYHWHVCTEKGGTCDAPKTDVEPHTFGKEGKDRFFCTKCGQDNMTLINSVNERIDAITESILTGTPNAEELAADVAEIRKDVDEAPEKYLEIFKTKDLALAEKYSQTLSELTKAKADLAALQAKLDAANQALQDAQDQLNDKEAELTAAKAELEQAEKTLDEKQAALEQANKDLAKKQAALEQANKDLAEKQAALEQANDAIAKTTADLEHAAALVRETDAALQEALNKQEELQALVDQLTADHDQGEALEQALQDLDAQKKIAAQRKAEKDAADAEAAKQKARAEQAEQDLAKIQADLEAAQTELDRTKAELEAAEQEAAAQKDAADNAALKNEQLTKELEAAQNELAEAKEKLQEAEQAKADAEAAADKAKKDAEEAIAQAQKDAKDAIRKAAEAVAAKEQAEEEAAEQVAAAQAAAEEAKKAEQAAKKAAEEAATKAEAAAKAQKEAEDAAQTAKDDAGEKAAAAEAAQKDADAAKAAAEDAMKEAESKADAAEAAQKAAEKAKLDGDADAAEKIAAAEAAQKAAEEAKAAAEAAEKDSEEKADAAQDAQKAAKEAEEIAEKAVTEKTDAAEKAKQDAEEAQKAAEAAKASADAAAKEAAEKADAAQAAQKAAEDAARAAQEKLAAADKAAAEKVTALIDAIGKVQKTNDCENAIVSARAAYDILTEEQKALVKNISVLIAAENGYKSLPQTGMSGFHKVIAGFAALLGITGAALVRKSKKEDA